MSRIPRRIENFIFFSRGRHNRNAKHNSQMEDEFSDPDFPGFHTLVGHHSKPKSKQQKRVRDEPEQASHGPLERRMPSVSFERLSCLPCGIGATINTAGGVNSARKVTQEFFPSAATSLTAFIVRAFMHVHHTDKTYTINADVANLIYDYLVDPPFTTPIPVPRASKLTLDCKGPDRRAGMSVNKSRLVLTEPTPSIADLNRGPLIIGGLILGDCLEVLHVLCIPHEFGSLRFASAKKVFTVMTLSCHDEWIKFDRLPGRVRETFGLEAKKPVFVFDPNYGNEVSPARPAKPFDFENAISAADIGRAILWLDTVTGSFKTHTNHIFLLMGFLLNRLLGCQASVREQKAFVVAEPLSRACPSIYASPSIYTIYCSGRDREFPVKLTMEAVTSMNDVQQAMAQIAQAVQQRLNDEITNADDETREVVIYSVDWDCVRVFNLLFVHDSKRGVGGWNLFLDTNARCIKLVRWRDFEIGMRYR